MISLYNTTSKRKESAIQDIMQTPYDPAAVWANSYNMYVCGPTVYDYAHIGNLRPAIVFDLWHSVMKDYGYNINHLSNFTDIDDKIIEKAADTGMSRTEVARKYEEAYMEDITPYIRNTVDRMRVTDHMDDIKKMIKQLILKGHAYVAKGNVLFDSESNEDFIFKALTLKKEFASYKRNPEDFILWKPDAEGWDSEWGVGRPGWHIECSSIIHAWLKEHEVENLDMHGGGNDLKFPHHANEYVQTVCAHNYKIAKTWMHVAPITLDNKKMSKSLGNTILIRDLAHIEPQIIRLAMLMTHYRHPLNWSDDRLELATKKMKKWMVVANMPVDPYDYTNTPVPYAFLKKLRDDLNTPAAITEIDLLIKNKNFVHAQRAMDFLM